MHRGSAARRRRGAAGAACVRPAAAAAARAGRRGRARAAAAAAAPPPSGARARPAAARCGGRRRARRAPSQPPRARAVRSVRRRADRLSPPGRARARIRRARPGADARRAAAARRPAASGRRRAGSPQTRVAKATPPAKPTPPPPPAPAPAAAAPAQARVLDFESNDAALDEALGRRRRQSCRPLRLRPAARLAADAARRSSAASQINERVAGSASTALQRCVSEQKARDADATGMLKMRWIIAGDGSVRDVKCLTPEFATSQFAQCIAGVVKGITLPALADDRQEVTFPFKF